MAPAPGLDEGLRQALFADAVKLAKHVGYRWAGGQSSSRGGGQRGSGEGSRGRQGEQQEQAGGSSRAPARVPLGAAPAPPYNN